MRSWRWGAVVAVLVALWPAVAFGVTWQSFNATPSVVPTSMYGGGHWATFSKPSAPVYQGKQLVQRQPFTGDLVPFQRYMEGYDAMYASQGTTPTFPGVIQLSPCVATSATLSARMNLPFGVPPSYDTMADANAVQVATWAREAVRGSGGSPLRWQITETPGSIMTVRTYDLYTGVAVLVYFSSSKIYVPSFGGWEAACAAAVAAGNAVEGVYPDGQDVAHNAIPVSMTSQAVTMTGNWVAQIVVAQQVDYLIYDEAYPEHKFALAAGDFGVDFGITHEPVILGNSAGAAMNYTGGLSALGEGDARNPYRRAVLKAWGGKNADDSYWYSWRSSYMFNGGEGLFASTVQPTGHVDATTSPPVVRVRVAGSGLVQSLSMPGVILMNGEWDSNPVDLTPGAPQPVLPVMDTWSVWGGYQDKLASPVSTATLDAPVIEQPLETDPDHLQPDGAQEQIGDFFSSIPEFWLGDGWADMSPWVQEQGSGFADKVSTGLGGATGSLLWPFRVFDGWRSR